MFYLLSGKDDDLNSNELEKTLLNLTGKSSPFLLYFPTAMKNNKRSIDHFIRTFEGLSVFIKVVEVETLSYSELDALFSIADIIYIGGGNTAYLKNQFVKYNVDKLIKKYIVQNNKIFAGLSAGAILYSKCGMGDSLSYQSGDHYYNFQMVDGLNLIDLVFCPHYQKEDLYVFNEIGLSSKLALALEDDTAVLIDNNKINVFKANKRHSVYLFKDGIMEPIYPNNDYYIWKNIRFDISLNRIVYKWL